MSEPALFIYQIQPVRPEMLSAGPTPEEDQIISEHYTYLEGLTHAGVVLLAGRTLNAYPSAFGIVIFAASSDQEARRIMLDDPVVRKGVTRAELYPFRIALLGALSEP